MAISIHCPQCDRSYSLADSQAGKRVRCKGCPEVFVVPSPAGANEGESCPP